MSRFHPLPKPKEGSRVAAIVAACRGSLTVNPTGPRFTALHDLHDARVAQARERSAAEKTKATATTPTPTPKAAAPAPTPPPLSAAERAALERHRARKAAAERAAEETRRKAAVTASWQKATAHASDPVKRAKAALLPAKASASTKPAPVPAKAKADNHGWAAIHAKAARLFGTSRK